MPRPSLTLSGSLLAANVATRELTYRLLPYGEQGRTSRGLVTASRGTVTLPAPAQVVLNMEHDRTRPVARATTLVEDDTALVATFAVAATTAGNDLLEEVAAGLRPGVSVELDDVVIRDGRLMSARLVAAGAVVAPAFPSALLVASDTDPEDPAPDDTPDGDPAPGTDDPDADGDEDENTGDPMPSTDLTAAAPAAVPAALVATATPPMTAARVSQLLAQRHRGDVTAELTAALTDITSTASVAATPAQWISEVWSGVPYQRQVVPLVASGNLTSLKVIGWRWDVAPAGDDYAGDKAAIPSNAAVTEAVPYTAARFAGGHDVDRAFVDFAEAGFWDSYWANQARSYAMWSDAEAATGLVAGATAVTPAGTGVVAAIVAAALAVIPVGPPTFVLAGSAAFAELVERDPLAFLAGGLSLSTADGNVGGLRIQASSHVAADQVVVGTRNAATWYELGSTPIRVEAVNVANGGVDVAAFGYGVLGVDMPAGLAKATISVVTP